MPIPRPKTVRELLSLNIPTQPMYINQGVLPKGGTMVLGAGAKAGKSFVINTLRKNLAQGVPLFGLSQLAIESPARSLYVEGEIGEIGLQDRALMSYTDLTTAQMESMYYIPKDEAADLKLDSLGDWGVWRQVIGDLAPEVLIIDPLAAFHTTKEDDAVEFEKIFKRIEEMKLIHPERRMSVIIVHHSGKPSREGDPLDPYSMRGTSKLYDRPDTLFMIHRKKNLQNLDHLAWELEARFRFRRAPDFDDFKLIVNESNDGMVNFAGFKTSAQGLYPRMKIENVGAAGSNITLTGEQLNFQPVD